ncbi:MAG: ATP-binding cassette domain-containing protein [Acidobacteria bacterium]|nr:ATP-binding cassette domain-containing protein [Acidobacteriota bacterium]
MRPTSRQSLELPRVQVHSSNGQLLVDINAVHLEPGEVLAVTGPSGCGKSLWLHALFGLNYGQDRRQAVLSPQTGSFLVVQDPGSGLTPGLAIQDHFRDFSHSVQHRIRQVMDELGLSRALLSRTPDACSGGERQKLMVAMVVAQQFNMIACDEPTASLDTDSEGQLMDLLRTRCRQIQARLLFITHETEIIDAYADRVLVINGGRRAWLGGIEAWRAQQTFSMESIAWDSELGTELLTFRGVIPTQVPVAFSLAAGEWIWLIGKSGSGKTTLLHQIVGLLPGTVYLEGRCLATDYRKRSSKERKSIQMVWQQVERTFNPSRTLGVQLGDVADEMIAGLGLVNLDQNRVPAHFSTGELQRFALLRALSQSPRILLLDECVVSLDMDLREQVLRYLKQVTSERGIAVVATSHEPIFAGRMVNLDLLQKDRVEFGSRP